jgi:hypothetical protein
MARNRIVRWPVFLGSLVVSALIGWAVHLWSDLNFWVSWAIVFVAWILVGISTFFDDQSANDTSVRKDESA